jgi:hypothetical protein
MKKMSADKRTVSTDALETLGTIIGENEKRDAIHLAVIPVKAGCVLRAGQYITVNDGVATSDHRGPGIVDPFLFGDITEGQNFWMVLRPRIIKSLRHVWSHPDFPDENISQSPNEVSEIFTKAKSEKRIRDFLSTIDDLEYEEFLAAALSVYNDYESLNFGKVVSGEIPDDIWDHVEIVTGKKITNRPTYFACSC